MPIGARRLAERLGRRLDLWGRHRPLMPSPVLVLGNQKSGTTAIAAMLGHTTAQPVTLDFEGAYKVNAGEWDIRRLRRQAGRDFLRPILKEPEFTFLVPELRSLFAAPQWLFVVRSPLQNIRSILDRHGLEPTDPPERIAQGIADAPPAWHPVLDARWLDAPEGDVVTQLAWRWRRAAEVQGREGFPLVVYERFCADKAGEIARVAELVGLRIVRPLDNVADRQFQPRGANRGRSVTELFHPAQISRVVDICGEQMERLGYPGPE